MCIYKLYATRKTNVNESLSDVLKMMIERTNKLNVMEKRLELVVGARLRDRTIIENAISIQDRLMNKSNSWNGVKEIRKWCDSK